MRPGSDSVSSLPNRRLALEPLNLDMVEEYLCWSGCGSEANTQQMAMSLIVSSQSSFGRRGDWDPEGGDRGSKGSRSSQVAEPARKADEEAMATNSMSAVTW